jgi:hypothetical protein
MTAIIPADFPIFPVYEAAEFGLFKSLYLLPVFRYSCRLGRARASSTAMARHRRILPFRQKRFYLDDMIRDVKYGQLIGRN